MEAKAIHEIDRAAVHLLAAIDAHGAAVRDLLDPGHLDRLREAIVEFRKEILGLEMGPLYDAEEPDES